jgi:MFS family permease
MITHVVPMLTDRGYDIQTAALVASAQGIAVVFGRAITGYLLDRIWAPILATVVLLCPAVACLVLASAPSLTVATVAVVFVGFAGGADFDLVAYLTQRYFGLKHFGKVYGFLYPALVGAAGIAPGLFGRAYDVTGTYTLVLQIAAACFAAAAVLVLTLGRYPAQFAPPNADAA